MVEFLAQFHKLMITIIADITQGYACA